MKILFICTGNTCRSPMAEVIAKEHFRRNNLSHKVLSAGLHATGDLPASENARDAIAELDLNLEGHRNRHADRQLLEEADLVLTMTQDQRDLLRMAYFDLYGGIQKIRTLGAQDIEDPFFADMGTYRKVRDQIKELIENTNWEESQ